MDREQIIARLSARNGRTLSVRSSARARGDHDLNPGMPLGPQLVPAAVLVPLVCRADGMTVLLTQRTSHLHDHAGQICFPGGRVEPEDLHHEATALRETEEEVGLPPDRVDLVGRLDTYIVRSGYAVTPVVGLVTPPFPLRPDPFEVADVFEVPLSFVLDTRNHQRGSRMHEGKSRSFYALPYRDRYIWGATAGMLINLVEVLKDA